MGGVMPVQPLALLRGSLAMQTRESKDIENFFDKRPATAGEQAHVDGLINDYPNAQPRTKVPSFHYNCHGLTFASRRSEIVPSDVVQKILTEDRYEKVDLPNVLPGDTAIYVGADGEIAHSAIVLSLRRIGDKVVDTFVVSKWGGAHETIHASKYCPWSDSLVEYYRIRT